MLAAELRHPQSALLPELVLGNEGGTADGGIEEDEVACVVLAQHVAHGHERNAVVAVELERYVAQCVPSIAHLADALNALALEVTSGVLVVVAFNGAAQCRGTVVLRVRIVAHPDQEPELLRLLAALEQFHLVADGH